MEDQTLRTIIFYKNYYLDFYNTLSNSSRKKINQLLVYLKDHYQVPNNAVKHITNSSGIYEIRCTEGSNEYRVLFFFEEGTLISGGKIVILCNGFIKKNKKDLNKPLELAEFLKNEYLTTQKTPPNDTIMVHHRFLENVRYGIHRRRLKPAAIYSVAPLGLLLFY